jgi:phospholipid/cholesterol/gamma-HCH transport system substrate-binding protein
MNLLRAAELKVGLLVLVVAGLIAYMSMSVSENPNLFGRAHRAWFLVKDANGLVKGSQIKSAGIPVGVIKNVSLQDGQARVDLELKSDFPLYTSAAVEIKSQGILGDKNVGIVGGSPTDPPLPRDGQILNVKDSGSLDKVIESVGDIADNLKSTAQALKEAMTEDGSRKQILGRIVSNIEHLTEDLADITSRNKGKVNDIIDQVGRITKSLDEIINDNDEDSVKQQLKRAMAHMDSAMKNIDDITGKINRGEGTIGKLVNDEETVDNINTAIEGVNNFLDTADKLQTSLDFHTDYMANVSMTKTEVGLKLQPGLDRFYYIGVVDDPAGYSEQQIVTTSVNGGSTSVVDSTTVYKNKFVFDLLFGKNFWDLAIKGGVIENTGGVGVEYSFLRGRAKLELDAFDFTNMNLRTRLQYNIWRGIYVTGGMNDLMNNKGLYSNYIGAGLMLTNDDMKLLMTKLPIGR